MGDLLDQEKDEKFMASALAMARRGVGQTAPNPSVGAVLVVHDDKGDQIIARASTGAGGRPHAEPQVISQAGNNAKDATLYVTLEPCNHQGRTPPCTKAIINAGIKRVVIASTDKDARVSGAGVAALKAAGICVTTRVLEQEADTLNGGHFLRQTQNRPYTIVKTAISCDNLIAPGLMAGHSDKNEQGPVWVTSPLSRQRGWLLRAQVDAILIGTQTALIDNPSLTCRLKGLEGRSPQPIILDKDLKLPLSLNLFQTTAPIAPLIIHGPDISNAQIENYAPPSIELCECPLGKDNQIDLSALNHLLATRGITRLLVEGGPTLAKSYIKQGLADELAVFQGANALGSAGMPPFDDKPLSWALNEHPFELAYQLELQDNMYFRYQFIKPTSVYQE